MSVFADDSDLSAKRETALAAILDSLPLAYRIPLRGQFVLMVNAMDAEQLVMAIDDIKAGKQAAENGDMETILKLARHWASEQQIREYLPMAEQMLKAG